MDDHTASVSGLGSFRKAVSLRNDPLKSCSWKVTLFCNGAVYREWLVGCIAYLQIEKRSYRVQKYGECRPRSCPGPSCIPRDRQQDTPKQSRSCKATSRILDAISFWLSLVVERGILLLIADFLGIQSPALCLLWYTAFCGEMTLQRYIQKERKR